MNRAGAQLDAFGGELPGLGNIVEIDARVVHGQAVDVQLERLPRLVRLGRCGIGWRIRCGGWLGRIGRCGGGFSCWDLADVLPVAVAVFVAGQHQVQALDAHVAHLHFLAQQRQHAHGQPKHLQVGEGFGRLAQSGDAGVVQLQAQPRKQAPADIAIERQLDMGAIANQFTNLVFVVVGIKKVSQGKAESHDDQQQPEKGEPQDFAERFHGRVLVSSRSKFSPRV